MTEQFRQRVERILRQEGITLTVDAAMKVAHESAHDATLARVLHELNSRTNVLGSTDQGPRMDPAFRDFLKGLAPGYNSLAPAKKNELFWRFKQHQADANKPDEKARYESEMQARHGDAWLTAMAPQEKMSWAKLNGNSGFDPKTSNTERLHLELDQLRASTGGGWHVEMHRARRIADLEKTLGVES